MFAKDSVDGVEGGVNEGAHLSQPVDDERIMDECWCHGSKLSKHTWQH